MGKLVNQFLSLVDRVNEWTGKVVAFLIPVMMLLIAYEVVMRYFFRSPTIWVWDINVQLFALVLFLGGGQVLLRDQHVRVDVIYGNLSEKWKHVFSLVTFPVLFVFLVVLFWKFLVMTADSVKEREVTLTLFAPPVYPLKIVCSVGIFFFLLEAVAKFIRTVNFFRKDGE